MKTTNSISRRNFLRGSSAVALCLRAAATGLPVSFLMSGAMPTYAVGTAGKSLILAMSDDGEAINSYAGGTYSSDSNDPRFVIGRPSTAQLGTGVLGQVNGNNVTASDFSNSAQIKMGNTQVTAAKFFSSLPQDLLDHLAMFHLRTAANGHPEGTRVHTVNSVLVSKTGRGTEEIQSALMQEILLQDPAMPSVLSTPMVLNSGGGLGTLTSENVAITRYSPLDVKNLFVGTQPAATVDNMAKLYANTIDTIYKNVKTNGTAAQLRYLDAHASSRSQATTLGNQLGGLLTEVTGSSFGDQIKAAVAMAKVNLAPVIVVRYAYSGDNHNDDDLSQETRLTIAQLNNLVTYWNLVKAEGLQNSINFATYDIFGRTLGRNATGGRDHHNSSCVNMMIGANIKPGVIGGLEAWSNSGHRLMRATGINSTTGLSASADIAGTETLTAYARTLMASVGIPESRINFRIPAGKTVKGALLS
ncbi:DUF1501 domain-containing protein [Idiomarina sp. UBA4206]|uniref:DUF1501 domain-containing protein n=1 Tax=Idiomarina sp. UBA4206 TaxID=1946644 RepID=UPI0025797B63|nr:DUF1501 domain-containing protein [Idiomarina sp. UBA4206]